MAIKKLNLKSREDFADLALHDKNAYLQQVADEIMEARGDERFVLDKDALARLRRYYSRRSMADLKLQELGGGLRAAFEKIASGIRTDEVRKVLDHELPAGKTVRLTRPAPLDDAQLMFFVPSVHDAPLKDDFNLMDIAPFTLAKSGGPAVIRYELKDTLITIEGGAEVGLATAYDYDIVINMISHLAEATRRYRQDEAKGLRPTLPPRIYRPAAAEILKFCRRELGGKQYEDLERALARLEKTSIRMTSLGDKDARDRRTAAGGFNLIGQWKVVSRTNQDRIDLVEIQIPEWIYEGVVRPEGKPTILTLNPDYFLLSRPLARFIYRLARKAAGETEAFYSLKELYKRSGSSMPMRKFRQSVSDIVSASSAVPLPDYDLELEDRGHDMILIMRNRTKRLAAETAGA